MNVKIPCLVPIVFVIKTSIVLLTVGSCIITGIHQIRISDGSPFIVHPINSIIRQSINCLRKQKYLQTAVGFAKSGGRNLP